MEKIDLKKLRSQLEDLDRDLQKVNLQQPVKKPTYLEIINKKQLEDVSTRTLEFFFDTNEEHNLGDTCLRALLAVYHEKDKENKEQIYQIENTVFKTTSINREVSTDYGVPIAIRNNSSKKNNTDQRGKGAVPKQGHGRIDLLIETEYEIILIENKIYHHSEDNPLAKYYQSVQERNPDKNIIPILLVLDPKKQTPKKLDRFKVITHFEWAQKVKELLPSAWHQADSRYLTFLIDYIETIERMNPDKEENKMNEEIFNIFQKYRDLLIKVEEQSGKVCEFYQNKLNDLVKHEKLQTFFKNNTSEPNNNSYKYLGAYIYSRGYIYKPDKNTKYEIEFWLGWNLSVFILGICLAKGHSRFKNMKEILDKQRIEYKADDDASEIYLIYKEDAAHSDPHDIEKHINEVISKLNLR